MKAILLDGYGTLVEITEKHHPFRMLGGDNKLARRAFYEKALCEDLTPEQLLAPFGMSECEIGSIVSRLNAETQSIRAFEDSIAFLNHLNEAGVPWMIVSNLAKPYCQPLLNALQIDAGQCRFSCLTGLLKPDAMALLGPCEELGCDPSEALMIGDSLRDDVGGAIAAGLQYFHLDRSRHTLWDVPGIR